MEKNNNEYLNIQYLIDCYGWYIGIWQKRYGNGFYGMLSKKTFVNDIEDIITGGDTECVCLESYLWDKGNWLPIISSDSVLGVLNSLELMIEPYINNKVWINKSLYVFERIIEENDGSYGIEIAIDNDKEHFFTWNS